MRHRRQPDPEGVAVARVFSIISAEKRPTIHAVWVNHRAWCGVTARAGMVEHRGTMDDVTCPLCIGALKVGTPRPEARN